MQARTKSRWLLYLGGAILAIIFFFVTESINSQAPTRPQLRLHRGTFDVRIPNQTKGPVGFMAEASAAYAIIQFGGPITVADRQALTQTGLRLLEYLPDYAYLVQGTKRQLTAATNLPQVYGRASFTLADKLSPALLHALENGSSLPDKVRLIGWPNASNALQRDLQARNISQVTSVNRTLLLQLTQFESVRWIEPFSQPRLVNDVARQIMQVDPVWENRQLFGTGQIIAVADTGLDTGDLATLNPDFAGRVVATHALTTTGDWADNHGHGTHVAGSVAGSGVQSGAQPNQRDYAGSFAGVAPEAQLVIQGFEALPDGTTIGIDPDYYTIFAQAYASGAKLHTNSWGDPTGPITDTANAYGGYPFGSQRTDAFIWDHPDMAIFFAAGNDGRDGTPVPPFGFCTGSNGVVDSDSLYAPATAKNVITVGAAESNRPTTGLGPTPWILLNLCFGVQPIATDTIADNPNGMAAFSARGPADDGRIKPDLVAPGTNILSNRSHHPEATTLWGLHESNPNYVYSGGTSMATPLAAGAGVLIRQWLVAEGLANPSAAMIKAMLLNTTRTMAPGQYGTDATQEIPFEQPNNVSGWGAVDLRFLEPASGNTIWWDDHTTGLNTNGSIIYNHTGDQPLTVLTHTVPLRVMLVWTDPPASLSASTQLVNDLDLVITGPNGTTYLGNDGISADRINNVEGVIIPNPPLGQYQIEVRAFNVPVESQPFALAVTGPLSITSTLPPIQQYADVVMHKSVVPATVSPSQPLTYTLQFSNTGLLTATNVTIVDALPESVTIEQVASSDALVVQTSTSPTRYTWQVQDLAPGEGGAIQLQGHLAGTIDGGVVTNVATITTVTAETNRLNNADAVTINLPNSEPNLNLLKTVMGAGGAIQNLPLGSVITYTILYNNSGNQVAQNVILIDVLPTEITFGGWLDNPNNATEADGLISWSGDIGINEVSNLRFTATIKTEANLYGQTITNTVSLRSNTIPINRYSAALTTESEPTGNQPEAQLIYLPLVVK